MYTLAVDPGIRGCGVALFDGDTLIRAGYVVNPCKEGNGPHESARMAREVFWWDPNFQNNIGSRLALEYPRVYPSPRQKGDQNDLLPLAGVVCAVAAMFPRVEAVHYFPRDWKGTVDPEVMLSRIQARLSPSELQRVERCPNWLRHNVWDAIGIGLKATGRLDGARLIARG